MVRSERKGFMPAATKYKTEYTKDVIDHDIFDIPLTEQPGTTAPAMVSLIAAEAPLAERIVEFLSYAGMDVHMDFDQEADLFSLTVPGNQYEKSIKLMRVLLANEVMHSMEDEQKGRQFDAEPIRVHVKASDRYADISSSALSFFLIGTLLITVLLLATFDIIRFSFLGRGKILADMTLTTVGFLFLCIGFLSWRKALLLQTKIQEENMFNESVFQWFLSTYTGAQIDQSADATMDQDVAVHPEKQYTIISDEIRCLKRMDVIREYLKREYHQLDNEYVEYLCEELYQKVFE